MSGSDGKLKAYHVFYMVKYQNRAKYYRQSQCEGFNCSKFLQHIRHVDDVVTYTLQRDCVEILCGKKKENKEERTLIYPS